MKNNIIKTIIIISAVLVLTLIAAFIWYYTNVNGKNTDEKISVYIDLNSSNNVIAQVLEESQVIKSKLAFKIYTKLTKVSGLQAGTYHLTKNMPYDELVEELKKGKVFNDTSFYMTIREGISIKKLAKLIANETNNTEEDVFNLLKDKEYISLLIDKYWFLTNDITNSDIYYPLEGYLFPDTYQISSKDANVKEIFETMLNKMDLVLKEYKEDIEHLDYSIHEILSMASLAEREATYPEDRAEVCGVFYNRLNLKMSLGSDVTTYYAIGIELGERDLYKSELDAYNPYNTRGPKMEGKLPVGPICTVSEESIKAAIYPTETKNLYFVADKNGKLYFAKTNKEHADLVTSLKANGMWITFE